MHRGELIDKANGYRVIDCGECGYIHIDPVPSPDELEKVHRGEDYIDEKSTCIEWTGKDAVWGDMVCDDRFEFLEKMLPRSKRKLLDVGCGSGYFLKRARERGWNVLGVEPSLQGAASVRSLGIDVLNSFFDDDAVELIESNFGTFDAIHLSEVLEHVPNPGDILRRVWKLINSGGIICCVVPNDYSPIQKVLRDELLFKPYWLSPPHHINYFTFDSLEGLMKRCGFDVIERTAMFPMDLFLLMGDDYVGDESIGMVCHEKRKRFELLMNCSELKELKRKMYKLMAEHGVGRETVVFGVKNGGAAG